MTLNRHKNDDDGEKREGKYQPQRGKANNLPGATALKPQWKTPVMAMAKLIAFLFAEERAGAESNLVDDRRWAQLGINGESLLKKVRELLPSFDEEWERQGRQGGEKEKRAALFNRLFYMFTKRDERGDGRSTYSSEHPRISKRLNPFLSFAQNVYRANKPVTRQVVEAAFGQQPGLFGGTGS
jgi:hypothetical protein